MLLLLLAVNGHPGYQMYLPHTHVWTHTCNKQVMNPKSVKIIIPGIFVCVCEKEVFGRSCKVHSRVILRPNSS